MAVQDQDGAHTRTAVSLSISSPKIKKRVTPRPRYSQASSSHFGATPKISRLPTLGHTQKRPNGDLQIPPADARTYPRNSRFHLPPTETQSTNAKAQNTHSGPQARNQDTKKEGRVETQPAASARTGARTQRTQAEHTTNHQHTKHKTQGRTQAAQTRTKDKRERHTSTKGKAKSKAKTSGRRAHTGYGRAAKGAVIL